MSNLNRLAYFTAVVEEGSFTAAAERLGITKAVVSQQVARLEREFHTSLLIRSTRSVRTTEAGQAFYYRCAAILKDAREAFGELSESAAAPVGTLRLTAPFDYGIGVLVPVIAAFSERYRDCKVEVFFSDQTMDIMSGNIDLAIRVGWLTEQHLQARQIGTFRQLLVAPAGWKTRLRGLSSPEELTSLPFVANTALREHSRWTFSQEAHSQRTQRKVTMQTAILFDATLAVRQAAIAGAGLAILPEYTIAEDLAAGRLIHVLPQWYLPSGSISAVFPTARYRPAKVRAFIDMLTSRLET